MCLQGGVGSNASRECISPMVPSACAPAGFISRRETERNRLRLFRPRVLFEKQFSSAVYGLIGSLGLDSPIGNSRGIP